MFMTSTVRSRQDLGLVLHNFCANKVRKIPTKFTFQTSLQFLSSSNKTSLSCPMSRRGEASAPRRLSYRCEVKSWTRRAEQPAVSQTCLNCYQEGDKRLWQFSSRSLLSNLHSLGSRFPFNEAEKFNNSTIEEGKQCVGNESPPEVVPHIHRRPSSSYSQSTGDDEELCGRLKKIYHNPECRYMMS